jgi:phage tail sheath protein FI
MPIQLTYPGVYIEEIQSGVRTITGVATSVTAFIGRALKGPEDDPKTINSYGDFERIFGGLWKESTLGNAVRDFYLNGGQQAVIVRLQKGATAAVIPIVNFNLIAANPGSWGNNLTAILDHKTKDNTNTKIFNITIREVDPATKQAIKTEKFLNVSVEEKDPRYIPRVLEEQSSLVRVKKDGQGKWIVPGDHPGEGEIPATADSGGDGAALDQDAFTGAGKNTAKKGLYALEKADLFNMLCLPPYLPTDDVDSDLISKAAAYCEVRRAMLLVDPPSAWNDKDGAKNGVADIGTSSKNAALFFPRLKQPNPLSENQMEGFVPCGAVAGVFARTDTQRGIWKAPAGLDATLVGVPQLCVPLTDDENGELNQLGINCLRSMPAVGRVVWGSRTLQGDDRMASEWKYIPVRRTALFIEESLYRGTKWVVFEPNDEPLWAQIRLNIGAFMHNLFRQGAFQGSTPRDAYFVKCDKETTPQNDINLGIVNIIVGFAPLKPAEFVVIKIQQMAGQIQT